MATQGNEGGRSAPQKNTESVFPPLEEFYEPERLSDAGMPPVRTEWIILDKILYDGKVFESSFEKYRDDDERDSLYTTAYAKLIDYITTKVLKDWDDDWDDDPNEDFEAILGPERNPILPPTEFENRHFLFQSYEICEIPFGHDSFE